MKKEACFARNICQFVAFLFLFGCQPTPTPPNKTYPIHGTLTGANNTIPSVRIQHEDIPGLMPAMEMDFLLSDPKILDPFKLGEKVRVHGTLEVREGKHIITQLEKER